MIRTLMLVLTLGALGATVWLSAPQERALGQSGRADPRKGEQEGERPDSPTARRLVLGLMADHERQACGLTKLSDEELDRLDRWIWRLLLTMSATPSGELWERSRREETSATLHRQQMELEVTDLRHRLTEIRQESGQLLGYLSRARLAAERGDLLGVTSSLLLAESHATRIQRAAQ